MYTVVGASFDERLQAAYTLLENVPLIDAHNDLPYNIRKFVHNQLSEFNFDADLKNVPPWSNSNWSHTDLQRMKKGRVAAQVWYIIFNFFPHPLLLSIFKRIFSWANVVEKFHSKFNSMVALKLNCFQCVCTLSFGRLTCHARLSTRMLFSWRSNK